MPKKKKTLKHKLQTDKRRQETAVSSETMQRDTATFSLPQSYIKKAPASSPRLADKPTVITTHAYNYLGRDLLKTTLLTGSIIVIEILIRYYLERG